MIAAIAEWRPRGPRSNNIARAIPQIQHGGCESSTSYLRRVFLQLRVFFDVEDDATGRTENSCSALKSNFSPIAFQRVDFLLLFSIFLWKFVVKTVVFLYFLHKKCQVDCFLKVCVGSHLWKAWEYAMHPSTFAVAAIAGEWFPYDR